MRIQRDQKRRLFLPVPVSRGISGKARGPHRECNGSRVAAPSSRASGIEKKASGN
ncbi:hypothetical protein BDW69DRAFT_155181 [Aspergillus filifer]